MPENNVITSIYSGQAAMGAQFVDDPILKVKLLTLPALGLKVIIEHAKLRIEDLQALEPQQSALVKEAGLICRKLFPAAGILGFGFNFDINFRFNKVLPMGQWFEGFFGSKPFKNFDLRDFGLQFSLDNSRQGFSDQWFFKIISPLEMAAHLNRHFSSKKLPEEKYLAQIFEKCYNESEVVATNLKF